jgi:hypothetical protein
VTKSSVARPAGQPKCITAAGRLLPDLPKPRKKFVPGNAAQMPVMPPQAMQLPLVNDAVYENLHGLSSAPAAARSRVRLAYLRLLIGAVPRHGTGAAGQGHSNETGVPAFRRLENRGGRRRGVGDA